jgi:predicted Zn-dependent peptidase
METAFWLESDRMMSLAFTPKSLEVQRKVVCEEFKEHYLNKPYGDAWHILRKLAYTVHPYQWPTIGLNLEQIETAQLDDVKAFFFKHYRPVNAVLCVAGNVEVALMKELAERWFGDIPSGEPYVRSLAREPRQEQPRMATHYADVPLDALYKAWHIPARLDAGYYAADLLTEILGSGLSSRLYNQLVKEQQLFSGIQAYQTGSLDPGMLVVEGKVREGVATAVADVAVQQLINQFLDQGVAPQEVQKAKNKIEAMIAFEDMSLLSRANNLAFYELLGDAALINSEWSRYDSVTAESMMDTAREIFRPGNSNTLYYCKKVR